MPAGFTTAQEGRPPHDDFSVHALCPSSLLLTGGVQIWARLIARPSVQQGEFRCDGIRPQSSAAGDCMAQVREGTTGAPGASAAGATDTTDPGGYLSGI